MFRIIKAVDRSGLDKISEIKEKHSLNGELKLLSKGFPVYFIYNDDSKKMMVTTAVEKIIKENNVYKVITRNSEYWFEEIL